jgi:hypothetical protein
MSSHGVSGNSEYSFVIHDCHEDEQVRTCTFSLGKSVLERSSDRLRKVLQDATNFSIYDFDRTSRGREA